MSEGDRGVQRMRRVARRTLKRLIFTKNTRQRLGEIITWSPNVRGSAFSAGAWQPKGGSRWQRQENCVWGGLRKIGNQKLPRQDDEAPPEIENKKTRAALCTVRLCVATTPAHHCERMGSSHPAKARFWGKRNYFWS